MPQDTQTLDAQNAAILMDKCERVYHDWERNCITDLDYRVRIDKLRGELRALGVALLDNPADLASHA